MNKILHGAIGFSLAAGAAALVIYSTNQYFLEVALLCGFLAAIEGTNVYTEKRQWNTGYESQRQTNVKGIGFISSYIGVLLTIYGFIELNIGCPISGCNTSLALLDWHLALLYLGIFVTAAGSILMLWSKFVSMPLHLPQQRPLTARA